MPAARREFQIFAKPIGATCNLDCRYCYYLRKSELYPGDEPLRMPDDLLEEYIRQHILACPSPTVFFAWHGGEPTALGVDYFRRIVALQHKHAPPGRRVMNGIQTNGTLLDEGWCRFLAQNRFYVGLSLDGPRALHDAYRVTKGGQPTHQRVVQAMRLLQRHRVPTDTLCVVHDRNVGHPLEVYRYLKEIGADYIQFLPLVNRDAGDGGRDDCPTGVTTWGGGRDDRRTGVTTWGGGRDDRSTGVTAESVPAEAYGQFLSAIFREWMLHDMRRIGVQIFEEAAKPLLGLPHEMCHYRPTCGDAPALEHNGDFYTCDHFVDPEHLVGNLRRTPLVELLDSPMQRAFGQAKWDALPRQCRACEVLDMCHGGCPKDRFLRTSDGEEGLNYLCAGLKAFFTTVRPPLQALAASRRPGQVVTRIMDLPACGEALPAPVIGRNDPCPCGSGKKYKQCCMRKTLA